jgi:hypothetical protein
MAKNDSTQILEKGDIYFFYRPKVQSGHEALSDEPPKTHEDIQRFYLVLKPDKDEHYRLWILGRKRLPEPKKHEKHWISVDFVTTKREELLAQLKEFHYATKTRDERIQPEIRACGEGVYYLLQHKKNTYLAYRLELPTKAGDVQKELDIMPEASYIITVKNQVIAGVQGGKQAKYPKALQEKFSDLRFIPANPTELLNYTGAELLLIGASENVENQLGIAPEPEKESLNSAEIFNQLNLWKNEHTIEPLLKGEWK